MRSDMAKVIVERPRRGARFKYRKGYKKSLQTTPPEEWSKRESIYAHKGHTKFFNEHLGPLRRYLQKQVGRPWNKVHAEICERLRLDSVIQGHVRDHVEDFVALDVIEIDGVPCHGTGWQRGRPLGKFGWTFLYVCPRTGILRLIKPPRRVAPLTRICETDLRQYHRIGEVWFDVRLRKLPDEVDGLWEVLLEKPVRDCPADLLTRRYGMAAYAISKRPLKRDEARALLKRPRKTHRNKLTFVRPAQPA
jgi:hypothetical protein